MMLKIRRTNYNPTSEVSVGSLRPGTIFTGVFKGHNPGVYTAVGTERVTTHIILWESFPSPKRPDREAYTIWRVSADGDLLVRDFQEVDADLVIRDKED